MKACPGSLVRIKILPNYFLAKLFSRPAILFCIAAKFFSIPDILFATTAKHFSIVAILLLQRSHFFLQWPMFPQQRTNISPQWPSFPRSSVNNFFPQQRSVVIMLILSCGSTLNINNVCLHKPKYTYKDLNNKAIEFYNSLKTGSISRPK